jgi:hypothetical protein
MIAMLYLSLRTSDSASYFITLCAVQEPHCCYVEGRPILPYAHWWFGGACESGVQDVASPSNVSLGSPRVNFWRLQSQTASADTVLRSHDAYPVLPSDSTLCRWFGQPEELQETGHSTNNDALPPRLLLPTAAASAAS